VDKKVFHTRFAHYGHADSENPTFSLLTVSGRPVFYYVYFLAKKGRLSIMSGE